MTMGLNNFTFSRNLSIVTYLLSVAFLLISFQAFARYDYNSNCRQAMQSILDLKFRDARVFIANEKTVHPDNGYAIFLEHYADAIELIVTEEEELYERLIDNFEDRMDRMNKLDDGSPDNRWLQAEILFHTGLAQIKYGSRFGGATKLMSSYRKTREHRQKYPDFWQNRKLTGIFNIILDYIPPFMRWAADMFGYSGNAELGLFQLRQYCDDAAATPGFAEEGVMMAALGYKLTWGEPEGFAFLAGQPESMQSKTLVKYLYASAATYTYRNDLALSLLSDIRREDLQVNFYHLDYITGRCKLNHLEPDAAVYLQKYLDEFPGLDYKKDVCNRLSFHFLVHGDMERYREYREMTGRVGQELRDRDQEAVLESRTGCDPHPGLLRARLLCDGGYFNDAMQVLLAIRPDEMNIPPFRLEFLYRKGRILQLSGRQDEAIRELTACYDLGAKLPHTFACRSALYLGKIYEESKDSAKAAEWYEKCIGVYSTSHTTEGIREMASRALKRLK